MSFLFKIQQNENNSAYDRKHMLMKEFIVSKFVNILHANPLKNIYSNLLNLTTVD